MKKPTQRHALPELNRLVTIWQAVNDGEVLTLMNRRWLADLLAQIMDDQDVRGRFFQSVANRTPDQERAFWCAMWIADRVAKGKKVADAKREAGRTWGMSEERVRRAWLAHHRQAKHIVATTNSPDGLSLVIAQHRARCMKSR